MLNQLRFVIAELAEVGRTLRDGRPGMHITAPDLGQLESRVMLSASPAAALVESIAPEECSAEPECETDEVHQTESESASREQRTDVRQEIVFVDASVADYEQLLDDLRSTSDQDRQFEYYLLDGEQDGIQQISEVLSGHADLDAVHLVSHGSDGRVKLGNVWLDSDKLGAHAGEIATWNGSLKSDADLLIYGCDLASNANGQELVDSISALTGADVAASIDDTGHARYDGDWQLEYSTGQIDASVAFSNDVQTSWEGKLASITVDTTNDVVDGDTSSVSNLQGSKGADGFISLREAIIAINAGSGGKRFFSGRERTA